MPDKVIKSVSRMSELVFLDMFIHEVCRRKKFFEYFFVKKLFIDEGYYIQFSIFQSCLDHFYDLFLTL